MSDDKKPIFGRTDPSKYGEAPHCHSGAGTLAYMELLGTDVFDTNIMFFHRGIMPPGSGIGEHAHRHMEEMFIILDGPAQFTINGHTSMLPPASMALCVKGYSHGIYNPGKETLQYINVAVTDVKGKYDSVEYKDDLVNAKIESPPCFAWTSMDPRLLATSYGAHRGTGPILFRRMWNKESFKTNWEFVDHCILKPGSSIGYHQHNMIEEVYYIIEGGGRMTVNDVTWDVRAGDAIPCTLHDSHGLYNNGDEDLKLLVTSCAVEKGKRNTNNWGDDLTSR